MSGQHFKRARLLKKGSGRGSQTPGKLKGENCKAKPLWTFMARCARSRHHPLYAAWCKEMDSRNAARKLA